MSNYPDGMRNSRKLTIHQRCKICNHNWDAPAVEELGALRLANEEDESCPECGTECSN